MADTRERITKIIADMSNVDAELLKPEATLQGLDIDSLTATEIAMEIEDQLGVWFERDAELGWETVGDIFKAVEEQVD